MSLIKIFPFTRETERQTKRIHRLTGPQIHAENQTV